MHFRKIPWTQKTKAALDSLLPGRRSVWFDFDGTITYKIPAPDGWNYSHAAVDYALGYAGTCLGLFDNKDRYHELLQQLKDNKIDYDAFFSRNERECIVRQIDENSELSKNLGITADDLEPFRQQQGIGSDKPVLMCDELLEFIGYKVGLHLADRDLINNGVLDVIHDFQGRKVGGNKVHIDVITAASEDFNHGVMRAAVERYNATRNPSRSLEMPDIFLGKQFRYVDGTVTYNSESVRKPDGVETEINTEQPESLRKWHLMEAFKAKGAEIIAMFGDSIKWLGGDDAALNLLRDEEGNRIKKSKDAPKDRSFLQAWQDIAISWLYGGKEPKTETFDSPLGGYKTLYPCAVAFGERHSKKDQECPDVMSGYLAAQEQANLLRAENEERLRESAAAEANLGIKFGAARF